MPTSNQSEARDFIAEAPRQTRVRARADVVIAGGGPAGVAAAVAAARNGASVLLAERYGNLGGLFGVACSSIPGTPTAGVGFQGPDGNQLVGGIAWEWVKRIKDRGAAVGPVDRTVISNLPGGWLNIPYQHFSPKVDPEAVKAVAMEMVQEAGVKLLLHAWAVDAVVVDGVVKGIIIQSKAGREALLGNVVIDATADADIADAAGVAWDKVPKYQLYRMQAEAIVANVDGERVRAWVLANRDKFAYITFPAEGSEIPQGLQTPLAATMEMGEPGDLRVREDKLAILASRARASVGLGVRPGISYVAAGFNGDPTDLEDITQAEITGMEHVRQNVEWLRQRIPGFEDCYIVAEYPLGTRESRRIAGDYQVTEEDIRTGRRFADAIAQNIMPLDRHLSDGGFSYEMLSRPHDIPYRCMLPQGRENLLVAGRAISCDHIAHSSLRKVTCCLSTGEAAGTAAAMTLEGGGNPRQVDVTSLQQRLRRQGVILAAPEIATTA